MEIADNTNKYINEKEPWKLDQDQAIIVSTTAINVFKNLCVLLHPVIPNITLKMLSMLNVSAITNSSLSVKLLDTEILEFKPVLSRIEPMDVKKFQSEESQMEENAEDFINIEDFMKVDLRVAEVIEASYVEGADKLLSIKLSLGDLGEKNVFAGIKSAYEPNQLVGKLVVMVYNLAPRKMKFGNSEGMILAASDAEGGIFVISPDQGAKPGQKIK
jgi:methionyl-tRNA synthetase